MGKYLDALTNEEIEQILLDNNYSLLYNVNDCEGKALESIVRGKDVILVRCQDNTFGENPDIAELFKQFKTPDVYNQRLEIVQITDFYISVIKGEQTIDARDISLQADFESVMKSKFSDFKQAQKAFAESEQEQQR